MTKFIFNTVPEYVFKYWTNSKIKRYEGWYLNNKLHRLDWPAKIFYQWNGVLDTESWYQNGHLHRTNGPSHISYHKDGKTVEREEWYQNDKRHRLDGPSSITYDENGMKIIEYWYIYDKCIISFRNNQTQSPSFKKQWKELVAEWTLKTMIELPED